MRWGDVEEVGSEWLSSILATEQFAELRGPEELLLYSSDEISSLAKIPFPVVRQIQHKIAQAHPLPQPEKTLLLRLEIISLESGRLTEVCGCAGSGKTQLALQSAVACLNQFQGCSVIYICTEGSFPIRRLTQMGPAQLESIHVIFIADLETLHHLIEYQLEGTLEALGAKLVVIDSVVCDFRSEESSGSRSLLLAQIASSLKNFAATKNIFVLCLNQITAFVENCDNRLNYLRKSTPKSSDAGASLPALGLAWAQSVGVRYYLERTDYGRFLHSAHGLGSKLSIPFKISQPGLLLAEDPLLED